jgi:hypothetical protein
MMIMIDGNDDGLDGVYKSGSWILRETQSR